MTFISDIRRLETFFFMAEMNRKRLCETSLSEAMRLRRSPMPKGSGGTSAGSRPSMRGPSSPSWRVSLAAERRGRGVTRRVGSVIHRDRHHDVQVAFAEGEFARAGLVVELEAHGLGLALTQALDEEIRVEGDLSVVRVANRFQLGRSLSVRGRTTGDID